MATKAGNKRHRTPGRARGRPAIEKDMSILRWIALIAPIVTFMSFILKFVEDRAQAKQAGDCVLLIIMAVLIALELKVLEDSPQRLYLYIKPTHVAALIILSIGLTLSTRSMTETTDRILGGVTAFIAFLLIHRISLKYDNKPGFDHGTLVCAAIMGLYVGFDRIPALMLVMILMAALFYGALVAAGRLSLDWDSRSAIIPFLVLAGILVKSPCSEYVWVRIINVRHESKVDAIDKYWRNKGQIIHYSEDQSVCVTIDYDYETPSAKRMQETYEANRPYIKYVSSAVISERHFLTDVKNNIVFTVVPTYYVSHCQEKESVVAKTLRRIVVMGRILFGPAFLCFMLLLPLVSFKKMGLTYMLLVVSLSTVTIGGFGLYRWRWNAKDTFVLIEDTRSRHGLKLKAIEEFVHAEEAVSTHPSHSRAYIRTEYEDTSLRQDIKRAYQQANPQMVLLTARDAGKYVFEDVNTGYVFEVEPVYYVSDSTWEVQDQ
jgi:hypothetical protein